MMIQELNLVAFGPFTNRSLVFNQEEAGLHIIYGPNEAGKSSSLRGLKALLYGIDARTLDNFLHTNDKLLINGSLRNADGHELMFGRRKGNKNTLLSSDGNAIEDQSLTPFLQGVSQELFEMLFGIDHQALLQGGKEILEQKGEVGQALFSAAIGSHALHAVLEQLDNEASGLFLPQGSKPMINSALKSYKDLEKEIKAHSLSSSNWLKHDRALKKTVRELKQVQSELSDNRTEINRLNRIQSLLPKLALRREQLRELELLSDTVILPEDFAERRQHAVTALGTAQTILGTATPRLQGLQTDLEALTISKELLDQVENIEELHARLGGHRKALRDRPELESERELLLSVAGDLLKEVRLELKLSDAEILRPLLAKRHSITELGNKKALLVSQVQQTETSQRKTQQRLKNARKEQLKVPEMVSANALRRMITAARKLGDIDTVIQSTQSEVTALQTQCTTELSRLTLWSGSLKDLPRLALPSRESINVFEQTYVARDKELLSLQDNKKNSEKELQDATLHLDEIERVGAVPTENDLVDIRSIRDKVWQLLRRQWVNGEDVSTEVSHLDIEGALPDTFEERLTGADELSDRLRREADRVIKLASLQAKQAAMQQQLTELSQQLDVCVAQKSLVTDEWQALWKPCNILPRTPHEMRTWLDKAEKLCERVGHLNSLHQKSDELEQTRTTHIQLLNQQLETLEKPHSTSEALDTVLIECEELAQVLDEIKRHREALDQEITALESNLESLTDEHRLAKEKFETWTKQWRESIEIFGLKGDSPPSEVDDVIENIRVIFSKQSEAEKLDIRIKAISEEADSFCKLVTSLVTSISPELNNLSVEDAAMRLNTMLSENQSRLIQRQQINVQIKQAQKEIEESNTTIQIMTERLDTLCQEAKCEEHTELEEAERNSAGFLRARETIESFEKEILEIGKGAPVAELEVEAGEEDPDTLPGRIEELNNKIDDELEPKRTALAEAKGREEKELELMDGSDQAASFADQAQSILARINSDAEYYVRVKLASRILRDEIERYRADNQGPLVERASECFFMLTCGSFESLKTDYNDKDEPVLVGIRPNGDRVHVEGMSSGARDQLYLALRLASLEKYMEESEPMPFIVDDILVDFDDKRSEAALIALSQLSKKTQVILFTHHSNVVEQAKKIDGVHIQELR